MNNTGQTFQDLKNLQRFLIMHGVPFASFSFPGETAPVTMISDGSRVAFSSVKTALEAGNGFVMAPFASDRKLYFFKAHYIINGTFFDPVLVEIPKSTPILGSSDTKPINAPGYQTAIKSVIERIKEGFAGKVVISRVIENYQLNAHNAPDLFALLNDSQPGLFVYVAYLPGAGLWAGASPELLLSSDKNRVRTVALAGTQQAGQTEIWGQKELDEHEWVKMHIHHSLKSTGCRQIQVSETKTVKAGNAIHLKTEFEAVADEVSLASVIESLHPTPAVCGYPTEAAKKIISLTENYDREFYTGYLGPVFPGNNISLYVNLRCLQIQKNKTLIYAGGGITADSNPEKEWEETELKSRNMLSAIEKIQNLASDTETLQHEE